jgi:AcrR family transcriptional regulator
MKNHDLKTEDQIFATACNVFLRYGFHGTKTRQIAFSAGVNISLIHYYFRTKERLYAKVIEHLFERILNEPFKLSGEETAETAWFFSTEFYNNKMLFEKAVFSIYGNDALKKISKIRNWLGSAGFVNAVQ